MHRVVIDTNVVVSSNIVASGNPTEIMKRFYLGELQLFYSGRILDEYIKVLAYKRLNISAATQTAVIAAIKAGGIFIEPPISTISMPDESDRPFYDVATASGAILITGNTKDYPKEPFIMLPADFLLKIANKTK